MSTQKRALIIGMAGPAIEALGVVWETSHILISHLHGALSPRHMLFEPGFLVIFVGFLVSLVCIPVAIEVASARVEELSIPVLGPVEAEGAQALEAVELRPS